MGDFVNLSEGVVIDILGGGAIGSFLDMIFPTAEPVTMSNVLKVLVETSAQSVLFIFLSNNLDKWKTDRDLTNTNYMYTIMGYISQPNLVNKLTFLTEFVVSELNSLIDFKSTPSIDLKKKSPNPEFTSQNYSANKTFNSVPNDTNYIESTLFDY